MCTNGVALATGDSLNPPPPRLTIPPHVAHAAAAHDAMGREVDESQSAGQATASGAGRIAHAEVGVHQRHGVHEAARQDDFFSHVSLPPPKKPSKSRPFQGWNGYLIDLIAIFARFLWPIDIGRGSQPPNRSAKKLGQKAQAYQRVIRSISGMADFWREFRGGIPCLAEKITAEAP
jgi:hypothetical protein